MTIVTIDETKEYRDLESYLWSDAFNIRLAILENIYRMFTCYKITFLGIFLSFYAYERK